ncbi:MAG: flavodoxin domain-containing protein [Acidimicrobiia bacterium]
MGDIDKEPTGVLVAAASKHGSTAEIAERIGQVLSDRGLNVTVTAPEAVGALDGFRAVVLGSGVYAGHWLKEAKELANRIALFEPAPEVWLFSSGPLGDPPKPEEDPVDVADIEEATSAREHAVFAGKIDKSKLGFGERAIMVAVRAPEGDFRDWDEIAVWAEGIATALTSQARSG